MVESGGGVLDRITVEHVDALAAGATLLGSGGGGDVALGEPLLRHSLRSGSVELRRAAELPPDARVVHVGVLGAPDVLAERLIDPRDLAAAARAVVDHVGGELAAVGVIEIGGLNALAAVLAASQLEVPLIDGDLMGRAFPSINMTTMAVSGHTASPLAIVGPAGDTVVVPNCSARLAQALLASTAGAMGGAAALALYPTTASVLHTVGIRQTLSTCIALGEAFLSHRGDDSASLARRLGGSLLFEGRVDEIRPRYSHAPGSVTLTNLRSGSAARVDLLEEFLAVTVDGTTQASTPDVIVALDQSSGHLLGTDQVRLGQTLAIVTVPALHRWPDGAAAVVGPAAFGLDLEVVSR